MFCKYFLPLYVLSSVFAIGSVVVHAFCVPFKNLDLIQDYNDFCAFSRSFLFLTFTFRSMNNFELIMLWGKGRFISLHMNVQLIHHHLWRLSFPPSWQSVNPIVCISQIPHRVPLILVSVPIVPVFIVRIEISQRDIFTWFFFSPNFFGYSGCFWFPYKF